MEKLLKAFLIFILFTSNSYSQKVMFIGERGEFFGKLFLNDKNLSPKITNQLSDAKILVSIEPSIDEAKGYIKKNEFTGKKILFLFYYDLPRFFSSYPHFFFSGLTNYIDKHHLDYVSNSPFKKQPLNNKTRLLFQYEVWALVFNYLDRARPIEELRLVTK